MFKQKKQSDKSSLYVSDKKQLFIDEMFIAEKQGVKISMNRPELIEPVLEPGPPGAWDDSTAGHYGQVMEDAGKYRMWTIGTSAKARLNKTSMNSSSIIPLGYAESKDGIKWTKPDLGLIEFQGSKNNNIVCLDYGFVFIDPKAGKEEKYKLVCFGLHCIGGRSNADSVNPEKGGMYLYTSPDGLHWKWHPKRLFPFMPDTLNQMFYDKRIDKYVAYLRTWPKGFVHGSEHYYGRGIGRIEMDDPMQPWPYEKQDKPIYLWGEDCLPTVGLEVPTVLSYPDYLEEVHWTDIYNPSISPYPWAENVYLAFPSINYFFPDSEIGNHSKLDIGMAVSRDGIDWSWPTLDPYIPLGAKGSGYSGIMFMLGGLIRKGNLLYQYYGASEVEHGIRGKDLTIKQWYNCGRIFRTQQRLDGFVSVDFSGDLGCFTTPKLQFSGSTLNLNVDASAGEGRVEILDERGEIIPGFTAEECDPINKDLVSFKVTWKNKANLDVIQTNKIKLRFQMRNAKLYAFQFI